MDIYETISRLRVIIGLHDKMSKSYFFIPPSVAACRRSYEEANSLETEFEYSGDTIRVEQITECSCHHVYYKVKYYINGIPVSKNIRFIKKILKELTNLME